MVNQRSIRDSYKTLATKQKTAAPGVSPEHTEFDDTIEVMEELFNESDLEREALLEMRRRKR